MSGSHEHRLRVRYAEVDQMGWVHHGSYVLYMEEARTRMMADRGCSYAELERAGWGLAVRRMELRYRTGARYDEAIVVRTRVSRVRAASVAFGYEILREEDGELLVEGATELACIDLSAGPGRPVPLPPEVREALGGSARRSTRPPA